MTRFPRRAPRQPGKPLRCVFIGRLVPYKCPDVLIEAAAPLLQRGAVKLDFLGDGPMLASLRALAASHGVSDSVMFHGHVPHSELRDILADADLLTFPSIREFGGAVVIEAMALGIVPVIVNYGGPGEHVTPETGFTVPLGTRGEITVALRDRLEEIVARPDVLPAMAAAARQRVEERYDWMKKAAHVRSVYDWVLGRTSVVPEPCPIGA
jgi:glycosyltransferase involved in cell wall biosynthesis